MYSKTKLKRVHTRTYAHTHTTFFFVRSPLENELRSNNYTTPLGARSTILTRCWRVRLIDKLRICQVSRKYVYTSRWVYYSSMYFGFPSLSTQLRGDFSLSLTLCQSQSPGWCVYWVGMYVNRTGHTAVYISSSMFVLLSLHYLYWEHRTEMMTCAAARISKHKDLTS